jgi:hypothetical protein
MKKREDEIKLKLLPKNNWDWFYFSLGICAITMENDLNKVKFLPLKKLSKERHID